MKRWLPILTLLALACVVPSLTLDSPSHEILPSETVKVSATPARRPYLQPTFTPTPQLTVTSSPNMLPALSADSIRVYPSDLFPNDIYSVDVVPQIPLHFTHTLTMTVTFPDGTARQQTIEPTGLDGKQRARFTWVNQVPKGTSLITLTLALDMPKGLFTYGPSTVTMTTPIKVLPIALLHPPEPQARWVVTQTAGFRVYYVTGTKAERDLVYILSEADKAYNHITGFLGEYKQFVDIYVLDRVVGQGGYASSDWVAISYPDRAYSPIDLGPLLRHELTHRLDAAIGCAEAPAFLREGLAVLLAGGHYREEPIIRKASTVLSNGYMIPISRLLTDFYVYQHEVAYLEAAAFVAYIEQVYGWEGIETLCTASSTSEGTDLEKMNTAVQALANTDFDIFVDQYRLWLSQQPLTTVDRELFEYELQLMELMRAYQLIYDPAAHFLEGILFSPAEGKRKDIVADFVRGPNTEEAIAIELLLSAGQDAITRQDAQFLSTIIDMLETVLIDDDKDMRVFSEILALVNLTMNNGFEPYNLIFRGGSQYEVAMLDISRWPQSVVVNINWQDDRWIITGAQ